MKKTVIYGIGDFSDILSYIITEKLCAGIAAYTVNAAFIKAGDTIYAGKPLLPFEDIENRYPPEDYGMVLALIGKKMFDQRENAFKKAKEKGYVIENVIDPRANADMGTIGEGNIILAGTAIERHCVIGDGNIIWQNVVLPHHNRVGNFNNLAPSVSFSGYSSVGDHCFIGNNACIKNRIFIPDYVYIGAGSYVSKEVKSGTVLVPCRSYPLEGKSGFDFL